MDETQRPVHRFCLRHLRLLHTQAIGLAAGPVTLAIPSGSKPSPQESDLNSGLSVGWVSGCVYL